MPGGVLAVYEEARSIADLSPRGAAALLRLGLQILVDYLESGSANLDNKIGALVQKGLDPQVQQAMDTLRIIGNHAVHPGQIDLSEDAALIPALFNLLNLIVEQTIARPKHIASLFASMPEGARKHIEERDAAAT